MATHSIILAWRIPWTEQPDSPRGHKESDTIKVMQAARIHEVSLGRTSFGMLSLENVLEEKSHIYVCVCGCMCTQCGSASFRAFISSSTRVLISEKAYKCTEFEKKCSRIPP